MKKIILNIVILSQIILLTACSFGPPVKHYGNNKKLATNLPNVYVKDFQCWDSRPSDGASYSNVIFTLENNSKCHVNRNVKVVFYDGNVRMRTCNWRADDLVSYEMYMPPKSAYYGAATCDCEKYRKVEFKVTGLHDTCN